MKINQFVKALVSIVVISGITGCASIVDGGPRKFSVKSDPTDAKVTVFDSNGDEVSTQQTPAILSLKREAGYFKGANYKLKIEKPGYQVSEVAITSKIDGWYFGNVLLGGMIGFFAIDPVTGAMWTLTPKEANVALKQNVAHFNTEHGGIVVMLRKDVPQGLEARLVKITAQ